VTRNRALKQAVRERAARTGEKYSAARRAVVEEAPPVDAARIGRARIPSVLVPAREVLSAGDAIRRVEREGRRALSMLDDDELARFVPIEGVELPDGPAYLLVDVDTGHEFRNVRPDGALASILAAGRSPLTIEEGIAVVTHHPETIARNDGWSLLGSRCGDRRVCALWISKGAPKLGWCWAGNPHTWLGSASCAARVAV
jgi:Family of unknown function (DUF5701)